MSQFVITSLACPFLPSLFVTPCVHPPYRRRCSSGNELLPKQPKGPPSGRKHTPARPHCRGFPLSSRRLLTPPCRRQQGPTRLPSEPPVTARRRRARKRNARPGPCNPSRSISRRSCARSRRRQQQRQRRQRRHHRRRRLLASRFSGTLLRRRHRGRESRLRTG